MCPMPLSTVLSLQPVKAAEWCKAPQPTLKRAVAMHASWPSVSLNKQGYLLLIRSQSAASRNSMAAARHVLRCTWFVSVSLSSCPVQSACFLAGAHFTFLQKQMMELCLSVYGGREHHAWCVPVRAVEVKLSVSSVRASECCSVVSFKQHSGCYSTRHCAVCKAFLCTCPPCAGCLQPR
jgi:hypothetical protein